MLHDLDCERSSFSGRPKATYGCCDGLLDIFEALFVSKASVEASVYSREDFVECLVQNAILSVVGVRSLIGDDSSRHLLNLLCDLWTLNC
jgi:hypothetical protein